MNNITTLEEVEVWFEWDKTPDQIPDESSQFKQYPERFKPVACADSDGFGEANTWIYIRYVGYVGELDGELQITNITKGLRTKPGYDPLPGILKSGSQKCNVEDENCRTFYNKYAQSPTSNGVPGEAHTISVKPAEYIPVYEFDSSRFHMKHSVFDGMALQPASEYRFRVLASNQTKWKESSGKWQSTEEGTKKTTGVGPLSPFLSVYTASDSQISASSSFVCADTSEDMSLHMLRSNQRHTIH
jgi:hypothetical protein